MATEHGEPFAMSGPTHNLGYEPDQFDVKPILAVPIVVAVTVALTYVTTSLIFNGIFDPKKGNDPGDVPAAAERGAVDLNERMMRISSTEDNAEVRQPRLEGMQLRKTVTRDDGFKITPEMTTGLPSDKGNPRFFKPEDLRIGGAYSKELGLTGKVDAGKKLVIAPVNKVIDLVVDEKLLPTAPNAKPLPVHAGWDRPKESNGGAVTGERK